jgi:hypothetical protein
LLDSAINVALFHFEFGNSVSQQTTNTIRSFQHHNIVPSARELLRGRKACWPRPDNSNSFSSFVMRDVWRNPPLVPCTIDDFYLYLLD